MVKIKGYYRPQEVAEAVRLLAQPGTMPLAGGTQLLAQPETAVEAVVDLQALGLDGIAASDGSLALGAMVRLETLATDERVPELVREMARREGPNTLRQASTLGGTVATADWESELYAALLVHAAAVTLQRVSGSETLPLAELSSAAGTLITGVTLETNGATAAARVARTPADKPIVAVVGRRVGDKVVLAVCGVAGRPILIAPSDIENLMPPADFRGTSAYRREMAAVLGQRVMAQLEG